MLDSQSDAAPDRATTADAPCAHEPCESDPTEGPQGKAPSSTPPPIELEVDAVHRLHRRPRPDGDVHASTHDEELARWNIGGSADPAHPSNRRSFHPAVRVVLDTTAVDSVPRRGRRSLSGRGILLQTRSQGYWPARLCYEHALRRADLGSGRLRFRMDIGASGAVSRTVLHEVDFEDRSLAVELSRCLLEAFKGLQFSPAPGRRIRVDVSAKLWPGDAPLPSVQASDPEEGDAEAAEQAEPDPRAIVAERRRREAFRDFARTALPLVTPCFEHGQTADSRLWGRLALWIEVDHRGNVRVVGEHDSRFPAPSVRTCVSAVLEGLSAPAARSESEQEAWVIGFRLHKRSPQEP